MEIPIFEIDPKASLGDVYRALAAVIHKPPIQSERSDGQLINFRVNLPRAEKMGVQNIGKGTLTFPSRNIGERFLIHLECNTRLKIRVGDKYLNFGEGRPAPEEIASMLKKLRWVPPEVEEQRLQTLQHLDEYISIDSLFMGYIDQETHNIFVFQREWKPQQSQIYLQVELTHALFRLRLGHPSHDVMEHFITIQFESVRNIFRGTDFGKEYVVFELYYPPAYEYGVMPQGIEAIVKGSRKRAAELDEAHGRIAPFVYQIHFTFTNDVDGPKFGQWCNLCGLRAPINKAIERGPWPGNTYSHQRLNIVHKWFRTIDFHVAFQCEALLCNGRVTPVQLLEVLKPEITKLLRRHTSLQTSQILRHFNSQIRNRDSRKITLLQCLKASIENSSAMHAPTPTAGLTYIHHLTVTPSGRRLDGPHIIQCNRVLRRYIDYQHHFLRVDFRDEQALQFRWTMDVDGTSFIEGRIGEIMRDGFTLAGRHFEFLGYSNAALKEHATWFLTPFEFRDPKLQTTYLVDAELIRNSLGDFSKAIMCPALYGARMAQAFSATDTTIKLTKDQWKVIPDIIRRERREDGSIRAWCHSDGVGTMSAELRNMIWDTFCDSRDMLRREQTRPWAYQVRIGGFKGVIVVDCFLSGVQLCLRDSMCKFETPETAPDAASHMEIEIEVARAYVHPTKMYLNRPCIQILERLGVPPEIFLRYQRKSVEAFAEAKQSMAQFIEVLRNHDLGISFRLGQTFKQLLSIIGDADLDTHAFGPFVRRLVDFSAVQVHRAIKYNSHIPIPGCWNLVGVVDEGVRYRSKIRRVRVLKDRQIFVAIRDPETEEIVYLKGQAWITRSPHVHPGDIQTVYAVGKPELEEDEECFFDKLLNVVVFSCTGDIRPLPSFLGGGDLDGDTYMVCMQPDLLLPTVGLRPASYEPVDKVMLDRASTIMDVGNFVIEYINYDMLGLLSHRLSIIADQSNEGFSDPRCKILAELCSQAVDFPKTGRQPEMDKLPKRYLAQKPDWSQTETMRGNPLNYYKSDKALGQLFRDIDIPPPPELTAPAPPGLAFARGTTRIIDALRPIILRYAIDVDITDSDIGNIFEQYSAELSHIAFSHSISNDYSTKLQEEEIILGAIMAPSSQPRYRKEKVSSLRLHSRHLVQLVNAKIGIFGKDSSERDVKIILARAWHTWLFALRHDDEFGRDSFGFIALNIIFQSLECLNERTVTEEATQGDAFYTGVIAPEGLEDEEIEA